MDLIKRGHTLHVPTWFLPRSLEDDERRTTRFQWFFPTAEEKYLVPQNILHDFIKLRPSLLGTLCILSFETSSLVLVGHIIRNHYSGAGFFTEQAYS